MDITQLVTTTAFQYSFISKYDEHAKIIKLKQNIVLQKSFVENVWISNIYP